jgi:hypothetical protein
MFLDTSVTDLPGLYPRLPNVSLLLTSAPSIRLIRPVSSTRCKRVPAY